MLLPVFQPTPPLRTPTTAAVMMEKSSEENSSGPDLRHFLHHGALLRLAGDDATIPLLLQHLDGFVGHASLQGHRRRREEESFRIPRQRLDRVRMPRHVAALVPEGVVPPARDNDPHALLAAQPRERLRQEAGAVDALHEVEVAELVGADLAKAVAVVQHDGDAGDVGAGLAGEEGGAAEEARQAEHAAALRVAGQEVEGQVRGLLDVGEHVGDVVDGVVVLARDGLGLLLHARAVEDALRGFAVDEDGVCDLAAGGGDGEGGERGPDCDLGVAADHGAGAAGGLLDEGGVEPGEALLEVDEGVEGAVEPAGGAGAHAVGVEASDGGVDDLGAVAELDGCDGGLTF